MSFPFSRRSSSASETVSAGGKGLAFVFELVQVLAISIAIVLPIRYFLAAPFYVKGASMEPNFFDHEYLIIDEISYRFREPERGDIVVFRYPKDPKQYFIKRVIGMPGETVEVANGKVRVYNDARPNGILLDEGEYLDQASFTAGTLTLTLKGDEYFLMGDNRNSSLDSRIFGAVRRSAIVGRVWLRGFPVDRWKTFVTPAYQL